MPRRLTVLLLAVFLAFSLVHAENNKVDSEVIKQVEKNGNAEVIININEGVEQGGILSKVEEMVHGDIISKIEDKENSIKFSSGGYAAEINKKELDSLIKDERVKYIEPVREFSILLHNSTRIVNATLAWSMLNSGLNLTGAGETICIIDTGINYSHPDLTGKNLTSCNLDCVNNEAAGCFENCSETDLNGHGTHVAGIAAASGGINGVARGAGFIGLKVFPGSARTGATTTGIKNAIDWCVSNSSIFNISVITMSLGTDALYNSYCDSNSPTLSSSINNAFARNISVTIATVNYENSTGISLPACIQNATPVSSTDKNDAISSFSNRNSIVKLMAPGGSSGNTGSCSGTVADENRICSTYLTGYISMSGTSMATPHVAGAIAIINQYLFLTGRTRTPKEIESVLNNTGKKITDTTGLNFSRVDIYSALISLDNSAPVVSLVSPLNNHINLSRNYTFSCNATDLALKNASFYLWNSSNSAVNLSSLVVSGNYFVFENDITNLPYDNYKWNCLFYDENGNSAFASNNFSLTIGSILTSLISPANDSYTNQNFTNFSCSASSETSYALSNITFYLWNSSNLLYNETKNISGTANTTSFNYTFSVENKYLWNCQSWNNNSNFSLAGNFSITYDISKPNLSLAEPYPSDETSSSASKIFYYNVSDNFNVSRCELIVNGISVLNNSNIISINNSFTKTFSPASYSWSINCSDYAGNYENSSLRTFIITAPAIQASSSGGGGGGGAEIAKTYVLTKEQIYSGYTQEMAKSEKVKFSIFDEKAEEHTLTLDYVGENFVNLTLKSSVIRIVLGIGQSIKLNLTSSAYYDLYIKLEDIVSGKAKLTIQTIHEQVTSSPEKEKIEENEKTEVEKPEINTGKVEYLRYASIILYSSLGIIILIIGYAMLKSFKKHFKARIVLNISKKK